MESLIITWRELLMVVILVLLVYIAEVVLLLRGKGSASTGVDGRSMQELEHEIALLRVQHQVMREELEQIKQLGKKVQDAPAASPYSQAIKLAQQGLDAGGIAAGCGISRGEADLIIALYRTHHS